MNYYCLSCKKPLSNITSMLCGYGATCRQKLKLKAVDRKDRQMDMFLEKSKANYEIIEQTDHILVIEDLGGDGISLTNDMRSVVLELVKYDHLGARKLIYKDSMGIYDEVVVKNGEFETFKSIGETCVISAMGKIMTGYKLGK